MLGPIVGDHISLWRGRNDVSYWRVHQPEIVRDTIGVGRVARTPVGERRFREAGMVHLHPTGTSATLLDLALTFGPSQSGTWRAGPGTPTGN